MKDKFFENIVYVCIALTLLGQVIMGKSYLGGQVAFLISNVIFLIRDFMLARPIGDKIKDSCFTAVTVGLLVLYGFGVFG